MKKAAGIAGVFCRFARRALVLKAPVPRLTIKHAVSLHVTLSLSSSRENLLFVTKSLMLFSAKKEVNTKNVSNLLSEIFEEGEEEGREKKKKEASNEIRVNERVIADKCSIEIHFQLFTHHFNLIFCLLTTSCW